MRLAERALREENTPASVLARSLGYTSDAAEDRDGCLQDVHWYGVSTVGGGFQSYTIGNILSVQFYAAAIKAHPGIPREIAKGEFGTLHGWLRNHLYQYGRKFGPGELVPRVAGESMSIKPYADYLHAKYSELYRLPQH